MAEPPPEGDNFVVQVFLLAQTLYGSHLVSRLAIINHPHNWTKDLVLPTMYFVLNFPFGESLRVIGLVA